MNLDDVTASELLCMYAMYCMIRDRATDRGRFDPTDFNLILHQFSDDTALNTLFFTSYANCPKNIYELIEDMCRLDWLVRLTDYKGDRVSSVRVVPIPDKHQAVIFATLL